MAGPRWVKLDVDYFRNPKALAAGRNGRDLHLASICWVHAQLTDGEIPPTALSTILRDAGVPTSAVARVVAAGLWVPNGSGYHLHDYTEMNGTRVEHEQSHALYLERQRRYNRKRQRRDDDE
jgi:hypothetical protein